MPEDMIPSVLYAQEDDKLIKAVAEELEVKDPEDEQAIEQILRNAQGDIGRGTMSDD